MASPHARVRQYLGSLTSDPSRHRRVLTRSSSLRLGVLVALLGGILAVIPQGANAAVTPAAVSPTVSATHGFPNWYQDTTGLRLQPCLDPADANCIVTASATFDPAKPQVFPTNFPDEFFYNQAQSAILATPGCKGAKAGKVSLLNSLEGAFVNGAPKYGDQMVFGRQRLILTGGLCPKSTYQAVGPYGTFDFTTDDAGALAKNQATTDVGCAPIAPATCDFKIALTSNQAKSFLRWDPSVAPAAPSGYIGDGTTLHRITGGSNGNAFSIVPTGKTPALSTALTTNQFTVMGKMAGPLAATPAAVDFGGQVAGTTSTAKVITVANLAQTATTPGNVSFAGVNPGDFKVSANTCTAALAQDATCTVSVQFKPVANASGARSATLVMRHNSFGASLSVPLSGTATAANNKPVITVDPGSIDFGPQRIIYSTTSRTVTVSNATGSAPLQISAVALNGGASTQFATTNHCTAPVAVGSTCTIDIAYSPVTKGAVTSSLKITSNDSATPVTTIALSGTGFGGNAAVSSDKTFGFPNWYRDEAGVRLQQCIDPDDTNCLVLPGGTYDGTNHNLAIPDNFPDEFFWFDADADVLTTPGCNGSAPGKLRFRFATEAAFANSVVDGDQMSFGRMRVQGQGGLCGNHDYTVVTPYGQWTVTTDDLGNLKPGANTTDTGCAPTAGNPCDFSLALRSNVLGGFLRWDPAVAPAAPAGYLGDPTVLHTVVGAPFSLNGQPVNYVAMYDGAVSDANLIAKTNKWNIMGKLGGPMVALGGTQDFGSAAVAGAAVQKTITLQNQGIDPVTVNGFSLTGAGSGAYTVGGNTCTSALAPNASCSVVVSFQPTDVGTQKASLVVTHTGLNSPMPVPLTGVGTPAQGTPALSLDAQPLGFAQLKTGRTSPAQLVTVSNAGGTAPLNLGAISASGDFTVSNGTCTGAVDLGKTCQLEVRYAPTSAGAQSGTLTVNAPGASPAVRTLSLSGVGFSGTKDAGKVSADNGFPTYYQDANGVRVVPCVNPADLCGAGLAIPDASSPVSFPGNFPDEFFFGSATSDKVTVTDTCDDGTEAGVDVSLEEAVEGAFAGTPIADGNQITFGRSRVFLVPHPKGGLCANSTYTFVTPYGEQSFDTDANGVFKRKDATIDTGCPGPTGCDFTSALNAPASTVPGTALDSQLDGLLRWAPGVGKDAPAGYLGDGVTLHQVVGGTYIPTGATEPVNYFEVKRNGTSLGKTDMWSVVGKQAAGLTGGPGVDFGNANTTGSTKTLPVTFSNIGTTAVAVASAAVTPSGSAFSAPTGTVCGGSVAGNGTCTVNVAFKPTSAGPATGTVQLLAADGSVLASVPVSGAAVTPAGPAASVSPTSLAFGSTVVGSPLTVSATVTNSGGQPLNLATPTVTGANAADFTASPGSACTGLAPGASCTVSVTFTPSAGGTRTATLSLPSNAAGTPTVALSGTGSAAQIQFKSPTASLGTQAIGRRTTGTFVITNAGTSPLTLGALPAPVPGANTTSTAFSVALGSCAAAVAPGKNCSISITFNAQAPAGAKSATLTFPNSNAANKATVQVTLAGSSK